jgi:hypothetical protein
MSQMSLNYHLRPNKAIDRMLFLELLMRLNGHIPITSYQYIGFGSYNFEEFKLFHKQLGITDMISLEANSNIFSRQIFNCPYTCITPIAKTSTSFITEDFEPQKPVIFWLDYNEPKRLREEIEEFCGLLGKLYSNDILRITLNANPSSLGGNDGEKDETIIANQRVEKLREKIGDFLPSPIEYSDISYDDYPKTLLIAIRNAINQFYSRSGTKRLVPLASYAYADGQQMLTFTGIVVDKEEEEKKVLENIEGWEFSSTKWGYYQRIAIPALTPKERIVLNEKLPCENAEEIAELFPFKFDNSPSSEAIENYRKYYRYYPNYHQVIF